MNLSSSGKKKSQIQFNKTGGKQGGNNVWFFEIHRHLGREVNLEI